MQTVDQFLELSIQYNTISFIEDDKNKDREVHEGTYRHMKIYKAQVNTTKYMANLLIVSRMFPRVATEKKQWL